MINAQTYVSFPTEQDSVAWRETSVWGDSGETLGVDHHFKYFLGDTIIDSLNYSKVYKSRVAFQFPNNYNKGILIGFLREENKQIFYLENNSWSVEDILYDFNLQVGDTLRRVNNFNKICTQIDSIQLDNGEFRKRFYFDFETEIVEGLGTIGNSNGGMVQFYGEAALDFGNDLICIFKKDTLLIKNYNYVDCFVIDSTLAIKNLDNQEVNVFPNPIKNILNFTHKTIKSNLYILTITGQKVYEQNSFSGKKIDVSFLKTGVYYLKMEGEVNGVVKIVKQ